MTSRRALALLGAACVLYTVLSLIDGDIAAIGTDSLSLTAVVLLWWGARRQPARGRLPWSLVAAGITVWFIGDVYWDAYTFATGEAPSMSFADVAYLAGYPLLAAGIVTMIRHRAVDHWRAGLLDAIGVAIASSLAAWVFIVPASAGGSTFEHVIAVAYPLADVVVLAALTWLVLSPGIRGLPSAFALAGFGFTLAIDVCLAIGVIAERSLGGWLDNAYPLTYLLLALAASHQRSSELTLPDPSPSDHLRPARVLFLGIALFSGPVIGTFTGSTGGMHRVLVLGTTLGIGTIVLVRFVSALRELEASRLAISVVAGTDVLTGLDNRRRFLETGERILGRIASEGGSAGVLMIDIDHFKTINDTYGHASGDAVLIELSRRCAAAIRPFDLLGRLGGDELAIVLPNCDEAETRHVANRVRELVVGSPFHLAADADGAPISVTLSLGATAGRYATMHHALADADAALYEAKRRGRDQLWLADHAHRQDVHAAAS